MGSIASKAAVQASQCDRPCHERAVGALLLNSCTKFLPIFPTSPTCFQSGFNNALKLYGPLFLVTAILNSKFRPQFYDIATKTVPAILRSSLFMGLTSGLYPLIICIYSRMFKGSLSHFVMWFAPFLASLAAISVEKQSRRTELTVYVANQAAEGVYRALAGRGFVPLISRGSDILYSLSFATLVLFHKTRPELVPSSVRVILNVMVGNEEKADVAEKMTGKLYRRVKHLIGSYLPGLFSKDDDDKSRICKHHSGCKSYATVGFLKAFLIAIGIRSIFVIPAAFIGMGPVKFFTRFKSVIMKILTRSTMNFALFFAVMSGGTRAANCLLRYLRNAEDGVNSFLAGLVGSLGVISFSNVDFAMYIVSKAAENLFAYGVAEKFITAPRYGSALLYSVSTATLFYLSAYEPHHLRSSYWNFLMKTSNGNWMHFNLSFFPIRKESGIADLADYNNWCALSCLRESSVNQGLVKRYVNSKSYEELYRQHLAPWF